MDAFKQQEPKTPLHFTLSSWDQEEGGITAGFTGRRGGLGTAPYDTLNLAFHVGDDHDTVIHNRRMLAEHLGFTLQDWTCAEQVHGRRIAVIGEMDRGAGSTGRHTAIQDSDGLLTDVPGVLLTSFYADCVPLYFLDPVRGVVGLAHAGWKGTVSGIAEAMVERMNEHYGSRSADIRCAIGPSIGMCCYEVDQVVMDRIAGLQLSRERQERPREPFFEEKGGGKTMLNLKEINRHIMIKAGILADHIECTTWCTSCRNDLFFSYRKDGGVTGRMASWMGIRKR
ncbi:hypothetical protein E6C60_1534 [Paenibacillus algicola]|uniref:Purine nucleoside phosphorylase n=1 Tax=Paenibacillus algicola TaxID=2565926 RepID=A0A4P8XKU5_9BACL|nr:peptidoglycan editing factor PgeF [Paenibacillus algicola]QCT02250.1 hypothetical protein E6C60_1534 [Paenibacillus algicola]